MAAQVCAVVFSSVGSAQRRLLLDMADFSHCRCKQQALSRKRLLNIYTKRPVIAGSFCAVQVMQFIHAFDEVVNVAELPDDYNPR